MPGVEEGAFSVGMRGGGGGGGKGDEEVGGGVEENSSPGLELKLPSSGYRFSLCILLSAD